MQYPVPYPACLFERLGQALKLASDQQTKCDEIRDEVDQSIHNGALLGPILEQVLEKITQEAHVLDVQE